MQLVLLGTGTPNAEPDRSGPSAAVTADGIPYIVDCGPGTVRRTSAAVLKGIPELSPAYMESLFITHLHSDHTAGLADMILTPWVLERKKPLRVWGPPGTKHMARHVLEAYSSDIAERQNGLEPANPTGCAVHTTEIQQGSVLEENGLKVEAFKVNHGTLPSFGYRFTHQQRSIVISGDTAPFPGMEEAYRRCDILLHEVYSERGLKSRNPDWQRYHRSVHTSALELAKIACTVKPGLLVLYHQLLHGEDEKELLEEIRSIYTGEVVYGRDLDVFTL